MIQRLSLSDVSFKANEAENSARNGYSSLIAENTQTAQKQNGYIANFMSVPMQGAGQKLDVIA